VNAAKASLWRCPRCGHQFVTRNLSHSCARFPLARHFAGKPAFVREIFDRLRAEVRRFGAFKVEAQKTRIVFQVRMRFVAGHPLRGGFRGHLLLLRPLPGAPVDRIEKVGRIYVHNFLLRSPEDVGPLAERLGLAYRIGCQEHVAGRGA
jgi:hypothetical protein